MIVDHINDLENQFEDCLIDAKWIEHDIINTNRVKK